MLKFLSKFLPLILHELVDALAKKLVEKQLNKTKENEQTKGNN